MAAVNPLQHLRQDPKASFADGDEALGPNAASIYLSTF
jgi:hypothetical protein